MVLLLRTSHGRPAPSCGPPELTSPASYFLALPYPSPSPCASSAALLLVFPAEEGCVLRAMEDDGGIAATVVIKARSAYTWLDKLRFLKGLLPPDGALDVSLNGAVVNETSHEVYKCSDLDVISLEETCKVLFNAKERIGRKSRKLCIVPKGATEHIFKELKQCTGQSDEGRVVANGGRVELWDDSVRFAPSGAEETAVGSMNGAGVEEDRFWTSGASERSDEAPMSMMSPKPAVVHRGPEEENERASPLKQNGRTSRLDSFGSEPPPRRDSSKAVVTRNRRSMSDLASNIAAKTQKLYKFEEARVVTQEHRQQRSGLKRRQSSEENGNASGKHQRQPTSGLEPAGTKPLPTPVSELASDHPSKRPADSLVYITYQVFLQAGRGGLTAREAASRIEDAGLGAVFQGLVKPRIKIGKIIRNNPYYFQAGEGRYILCEAIVGVTQPTPSPLPQFPPETNVQEKPPPEKTDSRKEAAAMARREGTARYWAQMNANGRSRSSKNRHSKPGASRSKLAPAQWKSDESFVIRKEGDEALRWETKSGKDEPVIQPHTKPRLKGMYKTAVGGKPCKRSDGKNWQCPLMAPPNSNYCEHHQKRMMKDTAES